MAVFGGGCGVGSDADGLLVLVEVGLEGKHLVTPAALEVLTIYKKKGLHVLIVQLLKY